MKHEYKTLEYNNINSKSMDVVIQATPVYSMTERDVSITHVPGRNGDIITDNGCYKNINRTYSLAKGYVYGPQPLQGTVKNGQQIFEWLTSAKGKYVKLKDDYDPDVYRLATYVGNGSIVDLFDKALTFEVTFNCKPQRFLNYGDIPVEYDYGQVSVNVNNRTHYEAKPIIKIENIPGGASANTMMSVKDSSGAEVSLVSFKGDANSISTISIDSETEECYYNDNSNASDKVSMNGKNFPILREGNTNISLQQYDRSDYEIPSYNTVIQSQQQICESSFSTRETTIASYEEKYNIRSYSSLIAERENSFEADAYFTRLTEICDEGVKIGEITYAQSYTIEGPSSYLSGVTVEFRETTYDDFIDDFNTYNLSFLKMVKASDLYEYLMSLSEDARLHKLLAYVGNDAGLLMAMQQIIGIAKDNDGYIIFLIKGKKMYRKENNTNVIREYDAVDDDLFIWVGYPDPDDERDDTDSKWEFIDERDDTDSKWEFISDFIKELNDNELPSYIRVERIIDKDRAVTAIIYRFNLSQYAGNVNIYWKDKVGFTGLMGKAGWDAATDRQQIVSYNWNWLRKSFIIGGNLLTSGDNFSLRFVSSCPESEPYLQYNFGVNAAKIFEVKLVNLTSVQIKSYKKGYYAIKYSKDDRTVWEQKTSVDEQIDSIDPKRSFKIEYLKEPPKYSDERDWPSWLNPNPVCYNNRYEQTDEQNPLLSTYLQFKVNLTAYYRKYVTRDDVETSTDFAEINSGSIFEPDEYIAVDDNVTIGRYYSDQWPNPEDVPDFPYDRAISINRHKPEIGANYLPEWLTYEVETKIKLNSDPTKEVTIKLTNIRYLWRSSEDGHAVLTEKKIPERGDMTYINDEFEEDRYQIDDVEELDDGSLQITLSNGKVYTNEDHMVRWYYETVPSEKYVYTKPNWYANVSDKVYDVDGNEIGYVSVEPTVYYYAGDNMESDGGFYKYDNTSAWVYYSKGDKTNPIIKTVFKDSTMFYFIESFPDSYADYYKGVNVWETNEDKPTEFTTEKSVPEEGDEIYSLLTHETLGKVESYENNVLMVNLFSSGTNVEASKKLINIPEWIDLLDIERLPEGNVNPLSINFKIQNAQSAGYYKSNSLVHWKNYDVNDIVLTSLVNETNTISHLVPSANSAEALENVRIIVTPKWWML